MTQHIPSLMQRTSKTIIEIDYTKARNKFITWQRLASIVAITAILGLAVELAIISYLVSEF